MNKQIRSLGVVLMALFVVLFGFLNYWQIVDAEDLNAHPANTRAVVRDFTRARGAIQTADGVVLARSVDSNDDFKLQRQYPEGALFGPVTGYFSFSFGTDGVERTYNDLLTGRDRKVELRRLGDILLEKDRTANVTLTLTKRLQQVASDALGTRRGAVVALDPRDGAVLAMVSFPSYDPTPLAGHNLDTVRGTWDLLNAAADKPLLPRTFRERYFPGSTFKVVTAAAALANGASPDGPPVFPTRRSLPLPQTAGQSLANFGGGSCGGDIANALRVSCNTAFAQLGLDLGGVKLGAGAEAFGFNRRPPLDLPNVASSFFPDGESLDGNKPALAKSAIGQQDVSASPLQMGLIAAAIANNGTAMVPHVFAEARNSDGEVVQRFKPRPWAQAVPPPVAAQMRDLMVGVVARGTGRRAAIPNVAVAGKTGTAQTGRDSSHAWFICFAPADAPTVAVAVILENQSNVNEVTGGVDAAPIARTVVEAALAQPRAPGP
jgi:peptidoglycan glycosyltransferase